MKHALTERARVFELCSIHSLTWLVLGNAVGVLLALLLMVPSLGSLLAPLSYGRWMSVHVNIQLYGWCSLPLMALLFLCYLPRSGTSRLPAWSVHAWSGVVLLGALSWLRGESSGKPFVEWSGTPRLAFSLAMLLLALALGVSFLRRRHSEDRRRGAMKALLLMLLLPIPILMYWASRPDLYPPINPDSGGPTGLSLLASSLVCVAVLLLVPLLAGRSPRLPGRVPQTFGALGLHFLALPLLAHGNHSHHESGQWLALATVSAWLPLLMRYYRAFEWTPASRVWLKSLVAWGAALLLTGLLAFLPGILESWKFTHSLVAHAHLALAGFATSLGLLCLTLIPSKEAFTTALGNRRLSHAWNGSLSVHVLALLGLGLLEQSSPDGLLPLGLTTTALLGLRLLAGGGQLLISWQWLRAALTSWKPSKTVTLKEQSS